MQGHGSATIVAKNNRSSRTAGHVDRKLLMMIDKGLIFEMHGLQLYKAANTKGM